MRLVARWGGAVLVSATGFALGWWVCARLIKLDEGISLGVAGAVLAILLAVAAWWVPGGADSKEADTAAGPRAGPTTNAISGGTFNGPVIQGRDITGLTFGASPPRSAPRPENPDAHR